MLRPRSLRWRIAVWYVALFSLEILLFSLFFDRLLASKLRDRLDATLRAELGTAVEMFRDELEEAHGDIAPAAAETASEMRVGESVVAVAVDGQVAAATDPARQSEIAKLISALPPPGQAAYFAWYGRHGARVFHQRLNAGGHAVVVLALGPLDSLDAVMRVERGFLLGFLPLMMGLAMAGGWALASRGLAPLKWMAGQAREITGSSLHRRLAIGEAATELRSLAESFNQLLARLDQAFDSMRRFVTDASHELRTPLTAIRGAADVALSRDRGAAEYQETLAIILDESRRLSRLVDDLLNLARADSGYFKLRMQELYANDLLEDCCRQAQAAADARGIHLNCAPGEDAAYRGDEELLRRLVMNLLDNAIRYTPEGGTVSAALKSEPARLEIRITDSGPGVPPEAAAHIFERFYRADEAGSRRDGGFGLGLSIVKWIAEAHHGAVTFASQPGAGSVFTVTLPR